MTGTASLTAEGVSVNFAGVQALAEVSLSLGRDEIVGLVGPNGAGKTTMINVLTGFQKAHHGAVSVDGQPTAGRAPDWFVRQGVVRSFQAVRLFRGLSVSENVEAALAGRGMSRHAARRRAAELLDYLGIGARAGLRADALSYADERRVGMARALALDPRFILLDEPAAGMTLSEAEALGRQIEAISDDFSCGVLLIEHNIRLVADICARLHVLAGGRTVDAGKPRDVMTNPAFRSAYLGEGYAA